MHPTIQSNKQKSHTDVLKKKKRKRKTHYHRNTSFPTQQPSSGTCQRADRSPGIFAPGSQQSLNSISAPERSFRLFFPNHLPLSLSPAGGTYIDCADREYYLSVPPLTWLPVDVLGLEVARLEEGEGEDRVARVVAERAEQLAALVLRRWLQGLPEVRLLREIDLGIGDMVNRWVLGRASTEKGEMIFGWYVWNRWKFSDSR